MSTPILQQNHLHDHYGQLVATYIMLIMKKIDFHMKVGVLINIHVIPVCSHAALYAVHYSKLELCFVLPNVQRPVFPPGLAMTDKELDAAGENDINTV